MKSILLATLMSIAPLTVFAQTQATATYRIRCNMADLTNKKDQNVFYKVIDLKAGEDVKLTAYNGHLFEIYADDLTGGGDAAPRHELLLSSRVEKTKAVIASAITIYSVEMPEIELQEGG